MTFGQWFSPSFTAGVGLGYGRDTVDVGTNGTQSNGQAFSTAIYGSYHPHNNVFVDGLLGYSALDFGSRRFVMPTSGFATGDRSGSQVFGSISTGYEYKGDGFLLSPYGRIEAAWTKLNGFTESGAAPFDLNLPRLGHYHAGERSQHARRVWHPAGLGPTESARAARIHARFHGIELGEHGLRRSQERLAFQATEGTAGRLYDKPLWRDPTDMGLPSLIIVAEFGDPAVLPCKCRSRPCRTSFSKPGRPTE